MSLKHALLGFLNYGPMTGYELKKFFDTSVVHFWNAELSQIYPTLRQMQSQGLVDMNVEVQHDRPNRKVYSITDDGRSELLEWLAKPAEPVQIRQPLFIKMFFGASIARQQLIQVLKHEVDQFRRDIASLQQLHSLIRSFTEEVGLRRDSFYWQLTLDAGIELSQAATDWFERAIGKIEQADGSDPAGPHPPGKSTEVRTAVEILDRFKAASGRTRAAVGAATARPGRNAEGSE